MKTGFPELASETSEFKASFPSTRRDLFFRILIILFCLFLIIYFGSAFLSMFMSMENPLECIFFLSVLMLLLVVFLIMYIFLRDLCWFPVLSMSLHENVLNLQCPLGKHAFPIYDLKIRNEFPVGKKLLQVMMLSLNQGNSGIDITARGEEEIRFLSDLSSWLEKKGVPVFHRREIIPSSFFYFFLSILNFTIAAVIYLLIILPLCGMLIWFWVPWFLDFDVNLIFMNYSGKIAGISLGMLLFLGSIRIWFWKLTALPWFMKTEQKKCIPVFIVEISTFIFGIGKHRKASLSIEKDALRISTKDEEWIIKKENVVGIDRRKKWGILPFPEVFIKRPVILSWKDEQGFEQGILLLMVHGWIGLKDYFLDGHLLNILKEWHEGKAPQDLEKKLSPGPRWITALLMIGLLIFWFYAPTLHNYAVDHFIRSAIWSPIIKKAPPRDLIPMCCGAQALFPGTLLFRQYGENTDSPSQMLQQWIGDPVMRKFRPISMGWLDIVPSFPGRPTHFLYKDQILWDLIMIPPVMHLESVSSPRLLSVEACRSFEMPFLTPLRISVSTALYKDEKIFFSKPVSDEKYPKVNLFLFDIKDETTRAIASMELENEQPPLFFPDGKHVLYDWKIISLQTGAIIPLSLPQKPLMPEINTMPTIHAFPMKDKLRFRIRYKKEDELSYDIWEIDPITAQVKVLLTLPKEIYLQSADENRFLLKQWFDKEESPQLLLFDLDTATSQPIIRVGTSMQTHSLVKNANHFLTFTDNAGILIHPLP